MAESGPEKPALTLLIKLGSALVHFVEFNSESGHPCDLESAKSVLSDPEVRQWMQAMTELAFLPVKR